MASLPFCPDNRNIGRDATFSTTSASVHGVALRGGKNGFTEHHINNAMICDMASHDPDAILAWVTFDPQHDDMVRQLDEYIALGATGVKLFTWVTGACWAPANHSTPWIWTIHG